MRARRSTAKLRQNYDAPRCVEDLMRQCIEAFAHELIERLFGPIGSQGLIGSCDLNIQFGDVSQRSVVVRL